MKNKLLVALGGFALYMGCKETPPTIIFHSIPKVDTTYVVSPVPAADPHNVLVEEYTGQTCSACPAGHEQLSELSSANPGRIIVSGLYVYDIPQSRPHELSRYDFRDSVAYTISKSAVYTKVGSLPLAGVDRVAVGGDRRINRPDWNATADSRLGLSSPVNLNVVSTSGTDGTYRITATVTYLETTTTKQNLSIYVVEDSMIDIQEYPAFDPDFPSGYDTFYHFNNVFRDMVAAAPSGEEILPSLASKEPGRTYQVTYNYKLKTTHSTPAIVPKNCRVIAFVTSADNYSVLQAVQAKLVP